MNLFRYAEESQHQYGKEPTTLKTGHFTQVIWRDSTELGVGMARNRNGEVYVVCNYNPAGNFLGSFTENVLPPVDASPTKRITFTDLKQQNAIDEQAWQQEALMVHNEYRRKHRVPDLRLSPELTAAAKVILWKLRYYHEYNCFSVTYMVDLTWLIEDSK